MLLVLHVVTSGRGKLGPAQYLHIVCRAAVCCNHTDIRRTPECTSKGDEIVPETWAVDCPLVIIQFNTLFTCLRAYTTTQRPIIK
jgi:hypothetical protein